MPISPTSESWVLVLVLFVLPLVLGVGGGVKWLIERSDRRREDREERERKGRAAPPTEAISQGQTIPFDAVTHFQTQASGCEIDRRILRDYLLRAGDDPDKIIKAGRQNLA